LNQYYLRARYYDQSIGRFTQQDSWQGAESEPITQLKYIYADVDPANMIDPSGRSAFSITGQMIALSILAILSTTAINSNNFFSLSRTTSADFDGTLTAKEQGLLTLLTMSGSTSIMNLSFKDSERDDTAEGDRRDLEAAAAATVEERGNGRYKAEVRCHIKKGVRSIGFTKIGIGYGSNIAEAITNGQASCNATLPRGTQARHCKAQRCWKGATQIPCPNLGN
jgi:hypothetical protein